MVHPKSASAEHDPLRRTRLLSRILDPEYAGSRPRSPSSLADLPQPSVFVDRWGTQHDPDFRPFGSYPVRTPSVDREHQSWPWDADDDDDDIPLPAFGSPRRSPTAVSHSSSSYQSSSSGSRSRSTSVVGYSSPASSPPASNTDRDPTRARIASPGKIPRSALFPWTPAQRAARLHELPKVPPPPPPVEEEEQDIPLALVDSRYVPGYGHILYPPSPSPAPTPPPAAHRATSPSPSSSGRKKNRPRAHTVPLPASPWANLATGDAEQEAEQPGPESSSCKQSLRQSVYSLGLKTKLGLHHMKARIRKASGAATRPLSL